MLNQHLMKNNDVPATILIVDDVPEVREAMKLFVDHMGYSTLTAEDGSEALSILAEQDVDVLVTDILMPGMDGLELINQCKVKFPNLKIVVITGGGKSTNTLPTDGDFANTVGKIAGVKYCFKKPIPPRELEKILEEILR